MIAWDLVLNEKDTSTVEVWCKFCGKDYLITTIPNEWVDDNSIAHRLEDGETVPVSVREIFDTAHRD